MAIVITQIGILLFKKQLHEDREYRIYNVRKPQELISCGFLRKEIKVDKSMNIDLYLFSLMNR